MNWKNTFDWRRLIHLIKNEILNTYRSLLVTIGAVAGVLLVIYLLEMTGHNPGNFLEAWYFIVLFIGGFLISSKSFSVIHDRRQNYIYLTLPASDYEKFVSKLILTSIGWTLAVTVGYVLFSIVAATVSQLIWDNSMGIFNPLKADYLVGIVAYLVLQSIFVFGSVYFKKNALAKTLGSLFLFGVSLCLVAGLIFRLVFAKYFPACGNWQIDFSQFPDSVYDMENFFRIFAEIIKYVFWILLAPYFWILSLFRFKETEV